MTPSTLLHMVGCWLTVVLDTLLQKLFSRGLPKLTKVGGSVQGLTAIVTGPTSGIGRETALELARKGAKVIVACRDLERGDALANELESIQKASGFPAAVRVLQLDLTDLASVEEFCDNVKKLQTPLHILINNAGVMDFSGRRKRTSQGFEQHMGVNHLAHFSLTLRLLPLLRESAAESNVGARIVNVASLMHVLGKLKPSDMHCKEGQYSLWRAYGNSKAAQILFTRCLRRFVLDEDVHVFAVHPGMVLTNIARNIPGWLFKLQAMICPIFLYTTEQGARASIHCATSTAAPRQGKASHGYIVSNCTASQPSPSCQDDTLAAFVWQWSAREVKLPSELDIFDVDKAIPRKGQQ